MTQRKRLGKTRRTADASVLSEIVDVLQQWGETFTAEEFRVELDYRCARLGLASPNPIQVGLHLTKLGLTARKERLYSLVA